MKANVKYIFRKSICNSAFSIILFFQLIASSAMGQEVPENKLKAVFLYNFTRFVNWPGHSFSADEAPFVIGIIGDDPFGRYLEEAVAGENINGRPIEIRRYKNINEINCHILYINYRDPDMIKKITSMLSGRNTLTVSDHSGFLKWGGMVRFFNENNRIRLQINANAAKEANLQVSSKLLSVAQLY